MAAALQRFTEIARAYKAEDYSAANEIQHKWTHAVGTLVEWHDAYSVQVPDLAADNSMVDGVINLALEWRELESIHCGLVTRDIVVERRVAHDVWVSNKRDASIEVLDIMLAQVTIPPADDHWSDLAPVTEWFERNRGRADLLHAIPSWVHATTWQWAERRLSAQGATIPLDTDLGGITFEQARSCYAFLVAMCQLNERCSVLLQTPETVLWFIRPSALHAMFAVRVGAKAASAFIELCTFRTGRRPITAPLIPSGEFIMVPSDLVSGTAFERTLLRAAAAEPSRAGRLGNILGVRARRWVERLGSISGAYVFERIVVRNRDGRTVGDLDVVAYDPAEHLLLVFETKWPIDAATLAESNKIDAQFDSGRAQLRRLREALPAGATVGWPDGVNIPPTVETRWWVGSAQQLDSRVYGDDDRIGSTSLRLLEHLLPCPSLAELDRRLRNPPIPTQGQDYEMVERTVKVGELVVNFPAISVSRRMPVPSADRRIHNGWT